MKLSFITLGCPDWNLDQIITQAVKLGFDGVEFRGYLHELGIYKLPEFSTQAQATAQRFADAGLEVPCFASSARAYNADEAARQASLEEVRQYARLCPLFKTPFIRVFPGAFGSLPPTIAIDKGARTLEAMFEIAEDHGARILVETHDEWVDSDLLHRLIGDLDGDYAGVVWDVSNPYRHHGEPPELTWINLGRYIEHTHWKDSLPDPEAPDGYRYVHFGEGDLPLTLMLNLLKKGNYQGYLAFEWEKRWHPELDGPETAFPRFIQTMRRLLE